MKRLLVLRLSALGDVIHTIPAAVLLRDALSDWSLSWAVEAPYAELVQIVTAIEPIPVRMKKWGREPLRSRSAIGTARRALRGASATVDFQGLMKSALVGRLSGAPLRFGFDRIAIREKGALLLNNRPIVVDAGEHVVDQNLSLARGVLAALGAQGGASTDLRAAFERFCSDTDGSLERHRGAVVLLPGAGKENKLWPAERFSTLARQVPNPLVVWGPNEHELASRIEAPIAPATNLRQLAWLLRHARAVVGADTGPLHLADALGTPVVGLYAPTNPRRNGPHGQLDRCVSHFGASKWMDSISVEEVMTMLDRVIR